MLSVTLLLLGCLAVAVIAGAVVAPSRMLNGEVKTDEWL